jgi:hypothetical protein
MNQQYRRAVIRTRFKVVQSIATRLDILALYAFTPQLQAYLHIRNPQGMEVEDKAAQDGQKDQNQQRSP